MADCKNTNVITPVYSQATPPTVSNGCVASGGLGGGVIVPPSSGGGSVVIVESGDQILVEDNSYVGVYSFKVNANLYTAIVATLNIAAYILDTLQSGLILRGETVDEIRLTWSYTKTIISQSLANEDFSGPPVEILTPPTLVIGDRDFTYTGEAVTDNLKFTLTGNDGEGQSGSVVNKSATLQFGNVITWGDYTDMLGQADTAIPALYADLLTQNNVVSNTKSRSFYTTGEENRHVFYILPKDLGEVIFSKNNLVGGYTRLKLVNGILKGLLDGGDVESDILITNSAGHQEAYFIYQSSNDDQLDVNSILTIT